MLRWNVIKEFVEKRHLLCFETVPKGAICNATVWFFCRERIFDLVARQVFIWFYNSRRRRQDTISHSLTELISDDILDTWLSFGENIFCLSAWEIPPQTVFFFLARSNFATFRIIFISFVMLFNVHRRNLFFDFHYLAKAWIFRLLLMLFTLRTKNICVNENCTVYFKS